MNEKAVFPVDPNLSKVYDRHMSVLVDLLKKAHVRRSTLEGSDEEKLKNLVIALEPDERQRYVETLSKFVDILCDMVISRASKVGYKQSRYTFKVDAQAESIRTACVAYRKKTVDVPSALVNEMAISSIVLFNTCGELVEQRRDMTDLDSESYWAIVLTFFEHTYSSNHVGYGIDIFETVDLYWLAVFLRIVACYDLISKAHSFELTQMEIVGSTKYNLISGDGSKLGLIKGHTVQKFFQALGAYLPAIQKTMSLYKKFHSVSGVYLTGWHERIIRNKEIIKQATQNTAFMDFFLKKHGNTKDLIVLMPMCYSTDEYLCSFTLIHNISISLSYNIMTPSLERSAHSDLAKNSKSQEVHGLSSYLGEDYRVLGMLSFTPFSQDICTSSGLPVSPILKKTGLGDYEKFLKCMMLEVIDSLLEVYEKWKEKEPRKKQEEEKEVGESDDVFLVRIKDEVGQHYSGGVPAVCGSEIINMLQKIGFDSRVTGDDYYMILKLDTGDEIRTKLALSLSDLCPKKECDTINIPWEYIVGVYYRQITGQDRRRILAILKSGRFKQAKKVIR